MKNRKMISEISDPYRIPMMIMNDYDYPLNVLSMMILLLRKLLIHWMIISDIHYLWRLWRSYNHDIWLKASKMSMQSIIATRFSLDKP
jgi:hypothetical protein